ncbi:MAG TPA: hypothetical protein VL688_05195 [Verrucomicrobiae bacterium]|jgi:hypothetical protein|nr:hypothetical protein [Verrucomicrobiae bacterium]
MSSIYEHLAKAHLKTTEKEKPELDLPIPPRNSSQLPKPPRFILIKVLAVLSLAASVAAAASSAYLFRALKAEQSKRAGLEGFYNQLLAGSEALKSRDQAFQDEFERVKYQMNTASQETQGVKSELERARIDFSNVEKKLLELEDKNGEVARKLEALSAPAPAAPAEAAASPAAANGAESPESASSSFAAGLDALTSDMENVAPSSAPAAAPAATAPAEEPKAKAGPQVMTVNRNFNFVVLNIGIRDSVKLGERMAVQQKGKDVATVEVEKLYDNFSAATIVEERAKAQIQEGDAVVRS